MTTNHSMTPKERWLALLRGEPTDRTPTDYWSTPEFHQKLKAAMGCADDESLWRALAIDRPRGVGPRCKLSHHPDDPQADIWGVRRQRIGHGSGAYDEVSYNPLAHVADVRELDAFRWPSPDDFDYTPITDAVRADDGYRIIRGGGYEPFLLYARLRGMEQAYEDLLLAPALTHAILDRIFAFFYEQNRRIFEAGEGRIGLFYLAEDLGSQTGPLFSIDTYQRFLLPGQRRMAALARSYGAYVIYHTDGAARPFVPELVNEVGIDILNPIQWRCPGMACIELARDFGDRIAFHGGIDNQHTLPFGSPADVTDEVHAVARAFQGARWICAPCHNIQSLTPVENVVAMYRAFEQATQTT